MNTAVSFRTRPEPTHFDGNLCSANPNTNTYDNSVGLEHLYELVCVRLEVVAKPHRHFLKVTMMQAIWKKATNILI
jgi:hypothetical protein